MSHRVLIVGDIYTEVQYLVDKIPVGNEFSIAEAAITVTGSKTINAARILTRLRNKVKLYGHVGDDVDGENAILFLKTHGISPKILRKPDNTTGKISVITDRDGKSSITLFRGANQSILVTDIEKLGSEIEMADIVYTATNLPLPSLYSLIKLASLYETKVFLDVPNQHRELELSKLSSISFFAPNRQEAELTLGIRIITIQDAFDCARQLRKSILGTIIITLDKDGCVVFEADESDPWHLKSIPITLVDDTAAGDIFRAIFVDSYLTSNSVRLAAEKATRIASSSTEVMGVDRTLTELSLV